MYRELGDFLWYMARHKPVWRDGELWTAAIGGVAAGVWFGCDATVVEAIRLHFADILTVASIIFGFASTTLVFYIQAASSWSKDARVERVAEKIVDWHVWTIICLLGLMGYSVLLWAFGCFLTCPWAKGAVYGFLAFLGLYCGFQMVNHTLTVRWVFRRSSDLEDTPKPGKSE
jgi:hypothetical protein